MSNNVTRRVALCIVCASLATPAFATASYALHHERGAAIFDGFSCGDFAADFKHQSGIDGPRYHIEMAYVEGFLTAALDKFEADNTEMRNWRPF